MVLPSFSFIIKNSHGIHSGFSTPHSLKKKKNVTETALFITKLLHVAVMLNHKPAVSQQ